MFKRSLNRLLVWFKKNSNYRRSRKLSDYRAMSMAERVTHSGALRSGRLTGCPLTRD